MNDTTPLGETTSGSNPPARLRMPPSASDIIDPLGTNIIKQWIDNMTECP